MARPFVSSSLALFDTRDGTHRLRGQAL